MNNQNANVVSFIESRDLGTDGAKVRNIFARAGEGLKLFLGMVCDTGHVSAMKQKGVMRFVEGSSFAISGNPKDYDEGTAYSVSLVMLTTQDTVKFSDAHALMGCTIDGAQHIRGVSRAKLSRFLGHVGSAGTVTSKVSRTVGKSGFFTGLGITCKSDNHSFTLCPGARENKWLLAYAAQLEKMTDSQLAMIRDKSKAK